MSLVAIAGLAVLGLGLRYVLKHGHGRGARSIGAFKTSASGAPLVFGSDSDPRHEDESEPGDGAGDGGSAGTGGGTDGGGDGE